MSILNRMGGIIAASVYPISEVDYCFTQYGRTYLSARESSAIELSLLTFRTACENETDVKSSGVLYTDRLTMPIKDKPASLDMCLQCGCIVVVTSAIGSRWVYGSKSYPLFGTCIPRLGTTPSDGNHFLVNLEAVNQVEACMLAD